jgi:mannose-6-phosphate isomerase-like protein (cupin superfamily)
MNASAQSAEWIELAVTCESEAVEAIARDAGITITAAETRRNIATRGVPLNHLVGREFFVGEVRLRGIRLCEPCGHLETMTTAGVRNALMHRAGLRASIVRGGTIRVGDPVGESLPAHLEDACHAIPFDEIARTLPLPDGKRSTAVFERDGVTVKLYAPRGTDPQQPHTRDEIYLVACGKGEFVSGETRRRFGANDFLFAPAGVAHRFENFSHDLHVWVIFFGAEKEIVTQ